MRVWGTCFELNWGFRVSGCGCWIKFKVLVFREGSGLRVSEAKGQGASTGSPVGFVFVAAQKCRCAHARETERKRERERKNRPDVEDPNYTVAGSSLHETCAEGFNLITNTLSPRTQELTLS